MRCKLVIKLQTTKAYRKESSVRGKGSAPGCVPKLLLGNADSAVRNQIDYVLCSQRWISSIQSAKTRPGADCGSDHELLIAKFRLKLKKVGKSPTPFSYDLNQIPYDNTVQVPNRFKGLDLIDRVSEELWIEVCDIVQEIGSKTIPKKKCKKAKCPVKRPYK